MKKFLVLLLLPLLVLGLTACKAECDEGYSDVDGECVMDDVTKPIITAEDSVTLDIHADFDPMVGVSATDDVDGTVTVSIRSNDLDVDAAGSYSIVYEATDAAGNVATHTTTVSVAVGFANHLSGVDLGKLTTDEKALVFAAAEAYLMDNMAGGIPLWTGAARVMFADRVQLFTTTYNTVMGYGVAFSSFTEDDSNVYMDGSNFGNAGENTWRTDFNVDPTTLNPWIAQDAVSSEHVGNFIGSLYTFLFDASKTGYVIEGEHANGDPMAVDGVEENGRIYSKVWQIELKDGLKWKFHPDIDTSGFAAGYDDLDASDYLWTWQTAYDNDWFRALSGGGDFISAGIKNAEAYSKGTVAWSSVGLSLAEGETNTLEIEFTTDKTAFDVKYMFAGSQTAINQAIYESVTEEDGTTTYGTSPETVASSGIYYMDVWTPGQLITYKKSDVFVDKDLYHYTGFQYRYVENTNAIWAEFQAGRLDSATVPGAEVENYATHDNVYSQPEANTWRININGFGTAEARDAYKEAHPELPINQTYEPEPILQYLEMKQALYYGADRYTAAVEVAKTFLPASTYMSSQYFLDAESGMSIRGFDAGQAVEDDYAGTSDGYFPDAATDLWTIAVDKALDAGFYDDYDPATATAENPYEIEFLFTFHTPDNLERIAFVGHLTTKYEELFVHAEKHIVAKFDVQAKPFPDHYDDYLDTASTDLGIGSISGSLLDAPSFLDVFNDDNAGGFTMNWGIDTHSANIPISFTVDGQPYTELWSYNAIAKALNGKTYIKDGIIQEYWDTEEAVIDAYLDMAGTTLESSSDGATLMEYALGVTEADMATDLEVEVVNATVVVGADGANYLYVIAEETGQFELVESLALFTEASVAIEQHTGYAPALFVGEATQLVDDAAVAADAYAIGLGAATLADLWTAAGDPPAEFAEAWAVTWDGDYGVWSDIYVVLHIGDYFIGFAWL